jgi:hypothetical protein
VFFLAEFVKHKADFPAINGEALFLGTILHSAEHNQFNYLHSERDYAHSDPNVGKVLSCSLHHMYAYPCPSCA